MSRPGISLLGKRSLVWLASLVLLSSCDNGSPSAACDQLVDAFARAWQRCGKSSYDSAKTSFAKAFNCGSTTKYDNDKVNQCVSALNSLDCSAVKNGVSPGACDTGALSQ